MTDDHEERVAIMSTDAGEVADDTGRDGRRPADLPENVVEPRCGDLVRFEHLDEPGLFEVVVTNRHEDRENHYSFSEENGSRVLNMDEREYVGLYDIDGSALWPRLYAEVDLLSRRRNAATGGVTYPGEVLDAAKADAEDGGTGE